jgi:hypothetical protein
MAAAKHTEFEPYVHPDDPAGYLKPGDTLMAGGYDFAWCYVVYEEVPGFPAYQIGTNGVLWSRSGNQYKPLLDRWVQVKGEQHQDGYLRATLGSGPGKRRVLIHDLVLELFIGPHPDGKECRHFNGNPADNRLLNLWWGTPAENAADKRRHGTLPIGSRVASSKLTEADVTEIHRLVTEGQTHREIAKNFGIHHSRICRIIRSKEWAHVEQNDHTRRLNGVDTRVGSLSRNSKLTESDVLEMCRLASEGWSHRKIGKRYGVNGSTVTRILTGERWKHVAR